MPTTTIQPVGLGELVADQLRAHLITDVVWRPGQITRIGSSVRRYYER